MTYLAGLVRAKSWCQKRWNTRRGTRTTPRYSPISTPNSTACRSAFQRASSGCVPLRCRLQMSFRDVAARNAAN